MSAWIATKHHEANSVVKFPTNMGKKTYREGFCFHAQSQKIKGQSKNCQQLGEDNTPSTAASCTEIGS